MRPSRNLARALLIGLAAVAGCKTSRPATEALPFIADDYPRAVAEARARKLPIFVEAWAPW